MSESIIGSGVLNPILDICFGIGAIIMFGELILVLKRGVSSAFTTRCVVELAVFGFLFAVCLDWVAGFNFFRDTVAPLVWKLLGVSSS